MRYSWDAQGREESATGNLGTDIGWKVDVKLLTGLACGRGYDGAIRCRWRSGEGGGGTQRRLASRCNLIFRPWNPRLRWAILALWFGRSVLALVLASSLLGGPLVRLSVSFE